MGAKRPRDLQAEDIPPDEPPGKDPPPSLDPPSSLDDLSNFPSDVAMPLNLGGGHGSSVEDGASDDDGLNDIDMILRNNLPFGEDRSTTDGAVHCRESSPNFTTSLEEEMAAVIDGVGEGARAVPTFNPDSTINFPAPDTPYGLVDGKPILSPLTPLAPPTLSFHPEDGPTVPPVFSTDYSPVSPTTKYAFLNPPARSFTSPPTAPYTNPPSNYSNPPSNYSNPPSNYSNPPSNYSNPGSNFSNPGSNLSNPGSNQSIYYQNSQSVIQAPKSVYPTHQVIPGLAASPNKMGGVGPMMNSVGNNNFNQSMSENGVTSCSTPNNPVFKMPYPNDVNISQNNFVNNNETNDNVYTLIQNNVQKDVKRMPGMVAQQTTILNSPQNIMPHQQNHVEPRQHPIPRHNVMQQNMMPRGMLTHSQTLLNPQQALQNGIPPLQNQTIMPQNSMGAQLHSIKPMIVTSSDLGSPSNQSAQQSRQLIHQPAQLLPSQPVAYPASRQRMLLPRQLSPTQEESIRGQAPPYKIMHQQTPSLQTAPQVMPQPAMQLALNVERCRGPQQSNMTRAQVFQNLLGIRGQRMSSQQHAVLRQAASTSPIKPMPAGAVSAGYSFHQGVYLNHPQQTFLVPDSRQPVAMAPAPRLANHQIPAAQEFGATRALLYPGTVDLNKSPTKSTKNTAKRSSNIKAKLKSKIDRSKTVSPKVNTAPKLFDGDSLLAQLEEVT